MFKVNLEKALVKENDNKFQKEEASINELLAILDKEKADDLDTLNRVFP
jgi:flagellin-specific chaperone FliS